MEEYLKVFKALSDETRLRIIKMLEVKSMCVCEITSIIGSATATISNHLKILKEAGLIVQNREEKFINYSINKKSDQFIKEILMLVKALDNDFIKSDKNSAINANRYNIC